MSNHHNFKDTVRLSFSLAWAQIKLRNEGSYLGILWYLLNPLSIFLIILFIRGNALSKTSILHYEAYLLLGLIIFNFFSKCISHSIILIEKNSGLLQTITFDSQSLVISEMIQMVFSHLFEIALLIVVMIYIHVSLIGIIWYILLFPFFLLFMLGLSFFFSAIGVYIIDLSNVWSVVSQLIFFVTPLFYILKPHTPLSLLNMFNPLYYYITMLRDVTIYLRVPPLMIIGMVIVMSIVSCGVGFVIFEKHKKKFAELT